MTKKLALGNYGVARGAYEAGCTVATAYPGTPSTEITEFISKFPEINAEWSPNEKVALEVAYGAAVAGARTICSMKHVGVNVAADPLFTAAYTGINAGLVIVTADDPGMHSSQNEQDSRFYARSAHVPMLEPSDSEEAKEYVKYAFKLSEEYDTPVFLRLTTRVAHSQSYISEAERQAVKLRPYVKNVSKYVMMPANAKGRHIVVEKRMDKLAQDCNKLELNKVEMRGNVGVVCAGGVYQYVREAMPDASIFKLGMVYPLPIKSLKKFSRKVDKIIVIEELEPFIENQLKASGIKCTGKDIFGKQGELNVAAIKARMSGEAVKSCEFSLPGRPPVLCAGCPHRGVFYCLNRLKLNVCGDIGCYTLGALAPLSAVDTVLCMGASIGMAVGMEKAQGREFAKKTVAVIGDSTFVHSGITGLIDAVYNKLNTKIIIVDNGTTGMTGQQNHPCTGRTISNEQTHSLDLETLCRACGAANVVTVDAYELAKVEKTIKEEMVKDGVSVIIFRKPCVMLDKSEKIPYEINSNCTKCRACIRLGCPAIVNSEAGPYIDKTLCTGCGVCAKVCKFNAMNEVVR